MSQPGFFDLDNRYESLSHLGDPLEVLGRAIPWETFRPVLNKALRKFNRYLDHEGLIARQGQLIDASIVPVPVQRNTREENARIKQGEVPEGWEKQSHKLQQKDTDARWVKMQGHNPLRLQEPRQR